MGAAIALLDVAAESGGAASADVSQSFPLMGRHGVAPAAQELLLVLAKDIGHFEPMLCHLLLPSPSEVRTSGMGRSSSGLVVVLSLRSET
jgi:hypothetical protein